MPTVIGHFVLEIEISKKNYFTIFLPVTYQIRVVIVGLERMREVNRQQTAAPSRHTYLLKVNNRNTRTRCEIYSKLTIKTTERRHIVNFEYILHLVLVFLLLTLGM